LPLWPSWTLLICRAAFTVAPISLTRNARRGQSAHAGRKSSWRKFGGKPHGLHVCAFRGMRQINHHPEAIHLGDHFPAERRQSVVIEVALGFSGVRIGELAVAIVRQRHVSAAPIVELLHSLDVGPDGISILHADDGDPQVLFVQSEDICGRQRQADTVGSDLFRQAMNGVEFRHRLAIGVVVAFWRQRTLADVNDHERDIRAAFDHLRNIDLGSQAHGVVAIRGEVRWLDIVVRVELEDALVNAFRFGNQRRIVRLRRTCPDRYQKQQTGGCHRIAGNDELSLGAFHYILLSR
jgi:hypothetical protein